jgi:hypothetical protein
MELAVCCFVLTQAPTVLLFVETLVTGVGRQVDNERCHDGIGPPSIFLSC